MSDTKTTAPTHEETIREELFWLATQHGGTLRPVDLVAAAESPLSPLHPRFTWDDTIAGARWRLEEARRLIRTVKIDVQLTPDRKVQCQAFVSLQADRPEIGYRMVAQVRLAEDLVAELLSTLESEVIGQLARISQFAAIIPETVRASAQELLDAIRAERHGS